MTVSSLVALMEDEVKKCGARVSILSSSILEKINYAELELL